MLATDVGGIGETLGHRAGQAPPLEADAEAWVPVVDDLTRDAVAHAFRSDTD